MTTNKIISQDLESIYKSNIDWARFKDKTILISGANGFLPAYMVEELLYVNRKNGVNLKVIALVRNLQRAKKRFADYLDNKNLEFIEQDVCNEIHYNGKIDYIIHAASQASPKYYNTDPVGTLNANVGGTMNLLELAKKNEVDTFLFFSSAEVYGQIANEAIPLNEDCYGYLDPTVLRSCYAESKRMGENMCISYAHQFGIKVKIIRPFHTFGPGMDLNDGRVFVDFVSDIVAGNNIIMKSDGSARRAYCYITDAIIGYFKVLLDGKVSEPYNVGNPNNEFSVLELAGILVSLFDSKKLKVIKSDSIEKNYLQSKVSRIIPDIEKIKKLGWAPCVSIQDGFYRTVMSYLN